MRWNEIVTEGADFECPNCGEYMGKAKEVPVKGTCSNCGDSFTNPGGVEIRKGNVEKFGRLIFEPEYEEGTTQGPLKTKDGKVLGSLIQYGSKWFDYDGGKWEAYCSAIKKSRKGFPDKLKAVEWIVRQTRAAKKAAVHEVMGDPMIFGRTVPNWEHEDEQEDAAMFSSDPMYQPAQVLFRDGKWQVWFSTEDHDFFATNLEAEAFLKKRGYTEFEGWETFSPQKPAGIDESYSVSGIDEIPSWDGLDLMDTAPVAEYQKRTRHADMPLRVWVYQKKGKFFVVQGDNEFTFKKPEQVAKWLDTNGYLDHMGTTDVNL